MSHIKISVIMPAYNCEKYLAQAIESILNQTFTDFEIIKSFDTLLVLCREDSNWITNGAMGSIRGHQFLKNCMEYIEERFEKNLAYHVSPVVTTNVYNAKEYPDMTILPSNYFYPYNPDDEKQPVKQFLYQMVTPNTIAIHHWAKSWELHAESKGSGICVLFKKIYEQISKGLK